MSKIKKSELKERLLYAGINEGMIDDLISAINKFKDRAKAKRLLKTVSDLEKKKQAAQKKQLDIKKSVDDFIDSQEDDDESENLRKLSQALGTYYSLKK
jgi:nucleoid-associated protein YejK